MPPLRLRSISGQRRGQEFVFAGPLVRIGRSRDNDLILPERDNPVSSAHHAEAILDASGQWSIVDAGSSNGTSVNGVPIARAALASGDTLALGDEEFRVTIGAAPYTPWIFAGIAALIVVTFSVGFLMVGRRAASPFESVAATSAPSVFLVAVEADGRRTPLGTAFTVNSKGMLATNAHIAAELDKRGAFAAGSGVRAVAVQGDTYAVRRITGAATAADWQPGSLKDDVALLQLEASAREPKPLKLGDIDLVNQMVRGTPIATLGFPAASTDPDKPRGRLSVDVVGDVRGGYLEVGLGIAPGMSGSPVFDQAGNVVGIVVGGDFGLPPGSADAAPPIATGTNWALTIIAVRTLLGL